VGHLLIGRVATFSVSGALRTKSVALSVKLVSLFVAIVLAGEVVAMPVERKSAGDSAPASVAAKPNRLIHESSPYLLLHANNPVDWYPWGEEAFAKARREDKPIFLSIGYSTCYWCHVMEREDFSNDHIARLMNQWFVSVKVDREEHPELDAAYMAATEALTGRGGWPNSLFLTFDLKPFFAGSYFPPEDRFGLPGFGKILESVHDGWLHRRTDLTKQAERVAVAMRAALETGTREGGPIPSKAQALAAVNAVKASYDRSFAGFKGPPKFPQVARLGLLWERSLEGDTEARKMVVDSLRAMSQGAIHDQLGGGFHRYTLDSTWRVPHFEKMLYDNALLAELLAEVSHNTGDTELDATARATCEFVLREMKTPEGGFASAIDAETNGVEGAAYTWARDELLAALGDDGFAFVGGIYGFAGEPNLEDGRYTLFLTASLDEHARRLGISPATLAQRLQPYLAQLRLIRGRRPRPMTDDKVLADWNGMMIAALANAGRLLGEPRYLEAARTTAAFVLGSMVGDDGTLRHAWRAGRSSIPAFLDDYAYLIRGLLVLHDATGEGRWLEAGERLAVEMQRRLGAEAGGYFLSAGASDLVVRTRSAADGAIPSGNGVAALDLLRLAELSRKVTYSRQAEGVLSAFSAELTAGPQAFPTLAVAVLRSGGTPRPVAASPVSVGGANEARADREASVVDAEAITPGPTLPDGWRPFEVRLSLTKGWHVNAHPASVDFFIATRVSGRVRNVAYPPGVELRLGFAEKPIKVYSGAVTIQGEVGPDAGSVTLVFQACDDRSCRAPVERILPLRPPRPETPRPPAP